MGNDVTRPKDDSRRGPKERKSRRAGSGSARRVSAILAPRIAFYLLTEYLEIRFVERGSLSVSLPRYIA